MATRVLSLEDFQAQIRRTGVAAAEAASIPTSKPKTPEEQWALLKPYVGRPLREIPVALVLLFTTSAAGVKTGGQMAVAVRALPLQDRNVTLSSSGEEFI